MSVIPKCLSGVFTTRRYTNPRLPYLPLPYPCITSVTQYYQLFYSALSAQIFFLYTWWSPNWCKPQGSGKPDHAYIRVWWLYYCILQVYQSWDR